jgi:Leucine-rich repeat (LRR) protein
MAQITRIYNLKAIPNITDLNLSLNLLTSIDLSGLNSLTSLGLTDNLLTSIDVSGLSNLTSLNVNVNSLTSLDITNLSSLIGLGASNNQLTSQAVDDILVNLDDFGLSGSYSVNLAGIPGTGNAIPGAAGFAAKTSLEGKGWTVAIND